MELQCFGTDADESVFGSFRGCFFGGHILEIHVFTHPVIGVLEFFFPECPRTGGL
jgi:hypothetical protein